MRKITLAISLLLLCSCYFDVPKGELTGSYSFEYKYIVDSLVLSKDNSYRRVLRLKTTNKIIYENIDTWSSSGSRLILDNFYHRIYSEELIINSKEVPSARITDMSFNPHINLYGNTVLDVSQYNYFVKINK
ncbi:MAG: hypothetical protein HRT66_12600 [Flavobacteriaceae bacterium]|nr:hypothetical protein [Flavobacteriaceae bacterium]